jgi:hypothetical protein
MSKRQIINYGISWKNMSTTCSPSGIVKLIADNPQDFKGAPLNLQIVERPFEDEKVLAANNQRKARPNF